MAIFNSYVKLPEGNVWVGISRNQLDDWISLGLFRKKWGLDGSTSATKEIWLLAQDQQPNKEDV